MPSTKQLIMCLTGEGGCGKSRVIKAMRQLAQEWGLADTLCVTATTGIAACLLGGLTWHKATGHMSFLKKSTPKIALLWHRIQMLIIDEVSMMGASELAWLDSHLRSLKGCQHKPFGGIHIVFALDFYQLPPVRNVPVYYADEGSLASGRAEEGQRLWRNKLNTAVVLKKNHRAKFDSA